jgi:TonB-linked SusC/RagA family outer membrane protein
LLIAPFAAFAQNGTVEGTIVDGDTNESLPGVQVFIPDLELGAVTNVDGQYTIGSVPAGTYTVEARFVGFQTATREVEVGDGETVTVDFTLRPSSIDLNEVVVTGTGGPVEKRTLGNTIATINAASLENAPIQSFSDLLQGREPGMVALPSGGLTGEGTRIRIRGSASLSQSNEPIVYIDGVRANNGGGFGGGYVGAGGGGSPSRLDDIPPEAIARVEILKGAAAATLFGTEASNGVIQVFTKRGTAGPPQFTFGSRLTAINYPSGAYPDQVGFPRTQEQADNIRNVLGKDVNPYQLVSENFPNRLVGTGFAQEYSGMVRGGGDTDLGGVTYLVTGRFLSEDGPFNGDPSIMPQGANTLANDAIQRAQGLMNVEVLPNEDLRLRVTAGYIDTDFETLQTNNNIYGTISLAQFSKPELVTEDNETGTIAFASVAESVQQTTTQQARRFNGSFNVNYRPLDILTLDAVFGVDYTNTTSTEFRPFGWNVDGFTTTEVRGAKRYATNNTLQLTLDTKAKVQNQLSELFSSDLTVGIQGFLDRNLLESGRGLSLPGPGFEVTSAAATQNIIETFTEVVNAGVFAQEQIGFNDFVFVTVGARYDANSAFGSEFSGVLYPKIAASLIPSDAPFWNGPIGPLSSVRFRAALGQSGLQPGAFDALTTYASLNSVTGAGVAPNNLGNPDLKPEISTEWEVGTELGLFDDRAALEATYWNRTVSDALVNRQFVPSGGFPNPQIVNIGELKGQGVELATRALVLNKENVSIDVFANASYLWEQVTDLGGAPPIKVGGSYPRYRNYLVEGYAPGTHFGVRLQDTPAGTLPVDLNGDGQPDTEEFLVAYLSSLTPADASLPSDPSTVLIAENVDSDGNILSPTGAASDFFLGKPAPDWQGGVGFDIGFLQNFELSTLFEYKTGNFYINNLTDAFRQANASIGRNLPTSAPVERDYVTGGVDAEGNPQNDGQVRLNALRSWLDENLALAPFAGLNTIKKADFLRWRELSLTYNVPTELVERFGGRRLSLTFSGRNLAMLTKYDGVDPELNAIGRGGGANGLEENFLDGVEAFGFPIPRRYSFSLRLGF